jgi:hypothetical protein
MRLTNAAFREFRLSTWLVGLAGRGNVRRAEINASDVTVPLVEHLREYPGANRHRPRARKLEVRRCTIANG